VRSSDELKVTLLDEYYSHRAPRFAAFVEDDYINDWIQSTIYLPQSALIVPSSVAYGELKQEQSRACHQEPSSAACSLQISLVMYGNESGVQISNQQSLRANVTLLVNATSDHAAPVYLKELTPGVLMPVERTNLHVLPAYELFNFPLPATSHTSATYLQRGFIGANMIVLYTLMTCVIVVKTIIAWRGNGCKHQLHLAGVGVVSYWLANLLFDATALLIMLLMMQAAVLVGGPPISEFFFFMPRLFIEGSVIFALAMTASSMAMVCLSINELSGQLLNLISTVIAFFMRLFLQRHSKLEPYVSLSMLLGYVSPSYAYASCLLEAFTLYIQHMQFKSGISGTDVLPSQRRIPYVYLNVLACQALVYLCLILILDKHCEIGTLVLSRMFSFFQRYSKSKIRRMHLTEARNPINDGDIELGIQRLASYGSFLSQSGMDGIRVVCSQDMGSLVFSSDVSVYRSKGQLALDKINFKMDAKSRVGDDLTFIDNSINDDVDTIDVYRDPGTQWMREIHSV
jgi:hypothetical protein